MKNLGRFFVVASLVLAGCGKTPDYSHSVSEPQGRMILNAHKRTKAQERLLSPVVKIMIGKSLCSASHVGNGVLLTAFHCISSILTAPKGKAPALTISSPSLNAPIGPLKGYAIVVPKMEDSQKLSGFGGKGEINRLPDLAVIKTRGKQRVALLSLPTLKIGTALLPVGETNLILAGYGLEDFGSYTNLGPFKWYHQPKKGNLNDGTGTIDSVGKYFYHLALREENSDESAALPGDSGGPLLKKEKDGTYATYGVLSTLGTGIEGDGFFSPLEYVLSNAYTRLDRKPVQEWLEKQLPE